MLRKALIHIRGFLTYAWYKLVYGHAFDCAGIPKMRRGLSLVIERGARIVLGKGVFFNSDCSINCRQEVCIGDDCLFGEVVRIYGHNHRFRNPDEPIASQGFRCSPVRIGNNVWVGSGVVILKGVTIGDNVIVGAGCVVDEDIPSRTIVKRNAELALIQW